MRSNTFAVMKKEFARFFGDKRMVISTLILPGIMIYVIYSFMGSALKDQFSPKEDYVPTVAVIELPASVDVLTQQAEFELTPIEEEKKAEYLSKIESREWDAVVVFPKDFDEAVEKYDPASGGTAPKVEIYYNSTRTESTSAYQLMNAILGEYENSLANKFDINPGQGEPGEDSTDLATEKDTSGSIFSSMLPMLLMIFLFSGCIAVAPEAIAGEKERGTIATLLVTPLKRSELAMGKIGALSIIALLSGISSTTGTLLSLPKLMGATESMSAVFYTVSDYVLLAVIILSTVLVLITLISIISAFAKTVKEAQTSVMPLMILVMLVGVTAMFGDGSKTESFYYLIPVYNSVQSMIAVFSFEPIMTNVLITVISNVVYAGFGIFVLTRMFNDEKIMFKR